MCCISKLFLALTPFLGFIASADEAVGTNSYQLRGAGRSLEDATSISDDDDLEDAGEEDELEALENETYWAMTANLSPCEVAFFEFTLSAECRTDKGVDAEHECSGTCHELVCSMEAACPAGSEITLIQRGSSSRELDVEKISATEVQELVQELLSAQATCPCSSRRLKPALRRIRKRAQARRGFRGGFQRVGRPGCSKFGWCRFR
mmetsp:Transcript_83020/g.146664  ORF Transcript_83020/g.146664 Transcript_83020/m.146664 type:complete len:206 (-) Transcript_83020:164-781(-)